MTDPLASGDGAPGLGAPPAPSPDRTTVDQAPLSPTEMASLLDELQASQAELTRQNTQLRRTQAELAETRDRYADLYDFAPVGYVTLDASGMVIEANLQSAAMLGQNRSAMHDRPFALFMDPRDRAALGTFLSRVMDTGKSEGAELRLLRQDGSHFYADIAAVPHCRPCGPNGQRGVRMTLTDATARRASDEALLQANLILEASPAFLIRYPVVRGEPEPVQYVSTNISRFGFSPRELLSGAVSPRQLVHPGDLPRVEATLRKNAAAHTDAFVLDYRLRTRDRQTRYVSDHVQLLRDSQGRVNAVQSLVVDVTDSMLARQDLETVLDSAPIPIVKVRIMDDGDRILEYQNPAAARLFGETALGKSCKPYLCKKETCPALSTGSGLVRDRECAVTTLYGERVMYKTARKLPDAPCIIEAMVDVTELMRTRQNLTRAMEAAEAANKAKSEFLATMSHEIRTPINGIMGMTELALQTELTEEQREYLDLARQSVLALLDIINDILDFSRIEAGRLDLVPEPFSPRRELNRCVRLFGTMAARQHNTLDLQVASDVPEILVGDAGRLLQVVANLVSNGLKFTKNGKVHLSLELAVPPPGGPPRATDREITLLFRVTDTGIGIPEDKHLRIFDAFTQLDGSLTRGAGGTGLGLSICKSLVEILGGRLWLTSCPGQGTTFYFTATCTLPDTPEEKEETTPPPPQALSPLSILLVEDNCINQLVAKRLLEWRGHSVTAVDSGQAALDVLRETSFDCVLMDVEMPGLNGLETLARLRDATVYGERADLPVVALTAHAVKGYREKMLAVGFDDYLSKPIDLGRLEAALRHCLAKSRPQSPNPDA